MSAKKRFELIFLAVFLILGFGLTVAFSSGCEGADDDDDGGGEGGDGEDGDGDEDDEGESDDEGGGDDSGSGDAPAMPHEPRENCDCHGDMHGGQYQAPDDCLSCHYK